MLNKNLGNAVRQTQLNEVYGCDQKNVLHVQSTTNNHVKASKVFTATTERVHGLLSSEKNDSREMTCTPNCNVNRLTVMSKLRQKFRSIVTKATISA